MAVAITIRVTRKRLAALKKKLRTGIVRRQVLFAVGKAVLEKVHEAFQAKSLGGSDASGLKWKPLAPFTIAAKTALKKKKPSISLDVLTETKLLMDSLTPPPGKSPTRRRDQIFKIGSNSVTVGTSRQWAYTHHHGIPGRLPQRRLWPEIQAWPQSWWQHITKAAKVALVEIITSTLRGQ